MLRLLIATILISLLSPFECLAEVITAGTEGVGVGSYSCGELASVVRQYGEPVMKLSVTSWVQGYMLGVNLYSGRDSYLDVRNSTDAVWPFISGYCDQHPLGKVHDGVFAYMDSLPVIKKQNAAIR